MYDTRSRAARVYAWPASLPSNKYLELLYSSLTQNGIEIRSLRWRPKSILRAAVDMHKRKWLHFHWAGSATPSAIGIVMYWMMIVLGMSVLKMGRVKVAWTVHNLVPHNSRWNRIDRFAYRILLRRFVNVVFTHSDWTLHRLKEDFGWSGHSVVVPHGNYMSVYPVKWERESLRTRYSTPRDAVVFLFVGTLSKYKGLDGLIESFKRLNDPLARLWIVGKGREEMCRELARLSADDPRIVIDARFIPDDELGSILGAADVVVLPYREITTSGSLVLAFSYGRPVIAPRIGSIPEYAAEDCAVLYNPDESDGLYTAMEEALSSDLTAMGTRAHDVARTWNWSEISKQLAAAFERV